MDIKKFSLIVVGLIWLLVGIGLSVAGIKWLTTLTFGPKLVFLIVISLLIGFLKGKFVLKKVALKYYKKANEIKFKKSDMLTGWIKILGVKGFILIGLMIGMGSFLRHSSIDRSILGIIYLAVGVALGYASKIFFNEK